MHAAVPPSRMAPLLRAFLFDALLAVLLVVGGSIAAAAVWTVWRAATLAAGGQPDAAAIQAAIGQPGALAQILFALFATSFAALVLYFWRRRADAGERTTAHAALRRRSTWGWTVLVGVAVFLGSSLLGWLARQLGSEPVPTNLALVEEAARNWPVFLFLFAVVLAPAYEELLFRRVFFGRFLAAGRPWLGLVVSSLAFALVHEVPGISHNPPLAVLQLWLIYGGMGAAFAWLYWRTGSLWAPFLAHALNNALALVVHGLI
ncbi:membrane protein [Pseudoxanthomonas suwonensis]|uniref:Membrane protein n=2 Tax=Pseudoxanthomonas suwonensis TaxID=314722 RepID=A0A0E3Z0Q4_9GAMM|nr:membrane protein [Pseudoxanthomonas suwonensis]